MAGGARVGDVQEEAAPAMKELHGREMGTPFGAVSWYGRSRLPSEQGTKDYACTILNLQKPQTSCFASFLASRRSSSCIPSVPSWTLF